MRGLLTAPVLHSGWWGVRGTCLEARVRAARRLPPPGLGALGSRDHKLQRARALLSHAARVAQRLHSTRGAHTSRVGSWLHGACLQRVLEGAVG